MPSMNAAAKAKVSLAVRSYADAVSEGLTEPWRAGIRAEGLRAVEGLPPQLDLAITRAKLPTKGAWWWAIFAILQWVGLAAALAGVLWLLGVAFVPALAPLLSPVPQVESWPLTTLLIVGGVLLGILLGVLGALIGGATASRRRRIARKALLGQVATVAEERVVAPIESELERTRRFTAALTTARSSS
jgi:hypothetical protein